MAFSDEDIREMFAQLGVCFVSDVSIFKYVDAPTSFVANATMVTHYTKIDGYEGIVELAYPVYELASAMWKGQLMFFDGACLAFECGPGALATDYCCN